MQYNRHRPHIVSVPVYGFHGAPALSIAAAGSSGPAWFCQINTCLSTVSNVCHFEMYSELSPRLFRRALIFYRVNIKTINIPTKNVCVRVSFNEGWAGSLIQPELNQQIYQMQMKNSMFLPPPPDGAPLLYKSSGELRLPRQRRGNTRSFVCSHLSHIQAWIKWFTVCASLEMLHIPRDPCSRTWRLLPQKTSLLQ